MSTSDDPLNNVSPKTRQRFENALERRRGRERSFQVVVPPSVMQHLEARAQPAQSNKSQAWVHWEYSPEEWTLFDAIDWRPVRLVFFGLLIGLPYALLFGGVAGLVNGSFVVALFPFVGVELLLLLLTWRVIFFSETRRRHKARQNQSHRVTFSKTGMWEAGIYFPLDEPNDNVILKKIKMTFQPSIIHFHWTAVPKPEYRGGRVPSYQPRKPIRVLVPRGHEEEAARLVERYQTEVIEARKQADQQRRNPYYPEPD